jgi:type IX secretion system PorP/SprF family membrane protein
MTVKIYIFVKSIKALMLKRFPLVFLALVMITVSSYAQDQANFTQYYLNPYILNPSFAGIDGKTSVSLIYRRQWMNIDGGPSVANFSLHTPINTRTSTGLSITNDKRGLMSATSALFTFGYNIPVNDQSAIRFGISAGGSWNALDVSKLDGFSDPAMADLIDSHASLSGNVGLSFHSKTFHVGLSVPQIFAPSIISQDGFAVTDVQPFQSLVIHASNRFYFNDNKNVFEPYLTYRLNDGLPPQYEGAGILHVNHVIWIGGSYKQDFGISALGGIKLKNMLAIGASYSLANSGENQLNSSTIEVSLNYLLGVRKKNTFMYSFVDTQKPKIRKPTKPNASDAIAQKRKEDEAARKKQQDEAAARKRDEDALAKKKQDEALAVKKRDEEALAQKKREEDIAKQKAAEDLARHQAEIQKRVDERKDEVVKPPDPTKTEGTHNPRFNQPILSTAEPEEGHHEHEQEQLQRLEVHKENPTEHHNEEGHPNAERHEFVKRGNHQKELAVADYVIGGVFRNEANAKHFSDGLDKLGFTTHFGHLTEKNLWYVYIIQTDDINKARAERDKARKMKILRDAWLLTVHH